MRTGYAAASGDVLIILDADQTVPPETLPKFYEILASGRGDFVNGTRLIYPYERGAMRPLNAIANRAFAAIFSYRPTRSSRTHSVVRKRSGPRTIAESPKGEATLAISIRSATTICYSVRRS
jgi:hypothetical protein